MHFLRILLAVASLCASPGYASEPRCEGELSGQWVLNPFHAQVLAAEIDTRYTPEVERHFFREAGFYEKHESVLALADEVEFDVGVDYESIGDIVHRRYPEKEVFSTDMSLEGVGREGRLTRMEFDNAGEFPAQWQGKFDAIVMANGMGTCCQRGKTCGGIPFEVPAISKFLGNVARSLNRKNPGAVVVLDGRHHGGCGTELLLPPLIQATRIIAAEFSLRATFLFEKESGWFTGLMLRPR